MIAIMASDVAATPEEDGDNAGRLHTHVDMTQLEYLSFT